MADSSNPTKPRSIPRRSDDDLDRLATVDDDAVADAAEYWRERAGGKWKELVDAETDAGDDGR
jgi:hypothetical protein